QIRRRASCSGRSQAVPHRSQSPHRRKRKAQDAHGERGHHWPHRRPCTAPAARYLPGDWRAARQRRPAMTPATASSRVDNIRHSLVGLKMPRALEMLDATLRRIEQGEIDGIEAIDDLLAEELSLREDRRIKAALRMARLPILKTLAGFDFSFQPSLDRNRIMALAGL